VRVRVHVDAEPMLPDARSSMRVFVLRELHRTLRGQDAYLDAVEVTARRLHRTRAPAWEVVAHVSARDGARFEVRSESPHPHAATEEAIYAIWQQVWERSSAARARDRRLPAARGSL
jgi:hypothetical protein